MDINGDTFLDIITLNRASDTVSVLLGDWAGSFVPQPPITVGDSPLEMNIIDINGDTFLDIITLSNENYDVSVLLGDGTGAFATQSE